MKNLNRNKCRRLVEELQKNHSSKILIPKGPSHMILMSQKL